MKNLMTYCMFAALISGGLKGAAANVKHGQNDKVNNPELERLPVECKLHVEIADREVVAKLTFRNPGSALVRVWKRNLLSDGKLTWSAFVISRNGEKVPYKGMTVKAPAPTLADYVEIEPRGTKSAEIVLDAYYDLRPQGHYRAQYRAFQPNPPEVGLSMTLSNVVEFKIR